LNSRGEKREIRGKESVIITRKSDGRYKLLWGNGLRENARKSQKGRMSENPRSAISKPGGKKGFPPEKSQTVESGKSATFGSMEGASYLGAGGGRGKFRRGKGGLVKGLSKLRGGMRIVQKGSGLPPKKLLGLQERKGL